MVDELTSNGVKFEHVDDPTLMTDDGNTFALEQEEKA